MNELRGTDVERLWVMFDREERVTKIANLAMVELGKIYKSLDEDDKKIFENEVITWVGSENPRRDFAGIALISEQRLLAGLPVLRSALASLASASGPSVPFDRANLERIIGRLETGLS